MALNLKEIWKGGEIPHSLIEKNLPLWSRDHEKLYDYFSYVIYRFRREQDAGYNGTYRDIATEGV